MAAHCSFTMLVLLSYSLFSTLSLITSVHGKVIFTADLIHRDSPLSPFYNTSEKHSDRVRKAFHRSINRAKYFLEKSSVSTDDLTSTLIYNIDNEYLMKMSLGSPSHEIIAPADTGSDLIWTQCKPCVHCYKQIAPIFDPKKSSTYKGLSCSSRPCGLTFGNVSCGERKSCDYEYRYGNGTTYTLGKLAVETFTFDSTSGQPVKVPNIAFGCGHNNGGPLAEEHLAGIVGLGGGPVSLISQLGSTIDYKFSYCFVNHHLHSKSKSKSGGKLNFGSHAEISGDGVVSTPLVPNVINQTFYYVTLEGLSVVEKRIAYKTSSNVDVDGPSTIKQGNIFIDSGTPYTLLPPDLYKELETEVKKAIHLEPTTGKQELSLCYRYTNDQDFNKLPTITAHFTGADIVFNHFNTFIEVEEGVICLAFIPFPKASIFGSIAQANFLVEYDLEKKKVSFKPTDCTKQG